MHTRIPIDEALLRHVSNLTGILSSREVVEFALRSLLQKRVEAAAQPRLLAEGESPEMSWLFEA
jgi:Arc/MetJ family transcription regulator